MVERKKEKAAAAAFIAVSVSAASNSRQDPITDLLKGSDKALDRDV